MGIFKKIQEVMDKEKDRLETQAAVRRKNKLDKIHKQMEIEKENQEIRKAQDKLKEIKNQGKKKIDFKGIADKILPKPQSERKKFPESYPADKKEKRKKTIATCDKCGFVELNTRNIGKTCFACGQGVMQ